MACAIGGVLTGNILGESPVLGALQNNGGTTRTHALPADSPAVNAGNPAPPNGLLNHCERLDQRFRIRGAGPGVGRCDMGAHERNALPGQVGASPGRSPAPVMIRNADREPSSRTSGRREAHLALPEIPVRPSSRCPDAGPPRGARSAR